MCKGFKHHVNTSLRCSKDIFVSISYELTIAPALIYSKIFRVVAGFAVWVYMTNSLWMFHIQRSVCLSSAKMNIIVKTAIITATVGIQIPLVFVSATDVPLGDGFSSLLPQPKGATADGFPFPLRPSEAGHLGHLLPLPPPSTPRRGDDKGWMLALHGWIPTLGWVGRIQICRWRFPVLGRTGTCLSIRCSIPQLPGSCLQDCDWKHFIC